MRELAIRVESATVGDVLDELLPLVLDRVRAPLSFAGQGAVRVTAQAIVRHQPAS
jgi:hypothetical protein